MEPTPLVALLIGLSSSLHCVGMCGAISGALGISLPAKVRGRRAQLIGFHLLLGLGRMTTYGTAGALAGLLGSTVLPTTAPGGAASLTRLLPDLITLALGLHLAGWLPRLALVERLSAPLWRALEPLDRYLLPLRTPLQALLYGMVWGWLPCGLVYWALLIAVTAGNLPGSAIFMIVFGAATLPSTLATGLLAGWARSLPRLPGAKQATGLLLAGLGLLALLHGVEMEPLSRSLPWVRSPGS
jgi:sulfite exporter TauE/SafE